MNTSTPITTHAATPEKVLADDFDYLPYGPASGWTHGNGLDTDIDYDRDYRITDIDVADLDEIMSLTYEYSDVSNITRILDNLGANDQQFGYDALRRLTSATGNYGDIDYTYDGVGNRLNRAIDKDGETTAEHYDYEAGSHRIDRVTTTNNSGTDTRQFEHDSSGNIVSDISGERELEMIVNARNRLEAIIKDGEQVGEYEYNALGQRVAKTSRYRGRLHAHFDNGNNNVAWSKNHLVLSESEGPQNGKAKNDIKGPDGPRNGPTRNADGLHSHDDNKPVTERLHFHYDQAGNLIAESDKHGNTVGEYIYLGNYRIAMTTTSLKHPTVTPDQSNRGASPHPSVILSASEGSRRPNTPLALYFIHNDHLGTPRKVTDAEQRIVWSMEQTPFGEVALTTEAIRMPMRFPGQYADIESGDSYNYFRDYDPSLGRYIQSDPIELRGGVNTYSYSLARPVGAIDLFGLETFGISFNISGGLGFGFTKGVNIVTDDYGNVAVQFVDGAGIHYGANLSGSVNVEHVSGEASVYDLMGAGRQTTGSVGSGIGLAFEASVFSGGQDPDYNPDFIGTAAGLGASIGTPASAAAYYTYTDGVVFNLQHIEEFFGEIANCFE